MSCYDSPRARLRAIYQVPGPRHAQSVLELSFGGAPEILDEDWPAENRFFCQLLADLAAGPSSAEPRQGLRYCSTPFSAGLPFPPQSFDQVILHFTLDDIALQHALASARETGDAWLKQIIEVLRPGGVLTGCGRNRSSPRYWLPRIYRFIGVGMPVRAVFGVGSCEQALGAAGLRDIQVFNLIHNAENPRTIISVRPHLSRPAFKHELQANRELFGGTAYFLRQIVVAASLNRFLEETLFFWGYKPC